MTVRIDPDLAGIPETLLIPLWARAYEGQHKNPIIVDPKAAEMIACIDYDFSRFEKARLSQVGVSVRTELFDRAVEAFLSENRGGIVVNLGAGLDTRYHRLGLEETQTLWYDLDVAESIVLRRRFFDETQTFRFIALSMFDLAWMQMIEDDGRPVLILAEGLFMYFDEASIKFLVHALADRFAGGRLVFEMLAPFLVGKAQKHDSLRHMDKAPEFKWALNDAQTMEAWHPAIRFVGEFNYFDYHKDRWGWFGRVARLPVIRPRFASRLVRLDFKETAAPS